MLVMDVGEEMCWRQLWDDVDWYKMFVTDSIHLENFHYNGKSRHHNDAVTNILNLSPSQSYQLKVVTNITVAGHDHDYN